MSVSQLTASSMYCFFNLWYLLFQLNNLKKMCIEAYIHSHSYTARDLNEKRQEIDSLDLYN